MFNIIGDCTSSALICENVTVNSKWLLFRVRIDLEHFRKKKVGRVVGRVVSYNNPYSPPPPPSLEEHCRGHF